MTVRSIDLITMLPRAGEVGRVQQQGEAQPHVLQHAQTAARQQQAERARHQVTQKPTSEQVSVRKDGDGRQGSGGEQPGKRSAPKEPVPEPTATLGIGRRLDVKL